MKEGLLNGQDETEARPHLIPENEDQHAAGPHHGQVPEAGRARCRRVHRGHHREGGGVVPEAPLMGFYEQMRKKLIPRTVDPAAIQAAEDLGLQELSVWGGLSVKTL